MKSVSINHILVRHPTSHISILERPSELVVWHHKYGMILYFSLILVSVARNLLPLMELYSCVQLMCFDFQGIKCGTCLRTFQKSVHSFRYS